MTTTKTTQRVFLIFETIAQKGPISLKELCESVALPRSAVHRAVQTLQERQWVRARLFDHSYEVTSRLDLVVAKSRAAAEELEMVTPVMKAMDSSQLYVDFGMFTEFGRFETLDSSDKALSIRRRHSFATSLMAKMVLRNLPKAEQLRHLDSYLKGASREETKLIHGKAFIDQLDQLPLKNASDPKYLMVRAISFPSGSFGALGLRSRGNQTTLADHDLDLLIENLTAHSL